MIAAAGRRPRDVAAASPAKRVVQPGRNCWRVERGSRFCCIQDGADYFRLVRHALLNARETVFILGWDIAAHANLCPDGAGRSRAPRSCRNPRPVGRRAQIADTASAAGSRGRTGTPPSPNHDRAIAGCGRRVRSPGPCSAARARQGFAASARAEAGARTTWQHRCVAVRRSPNRRQRSVLQQNQAPADSRWRPRRLR